MNGSLPWQLDLERTYLPTFRLDALSSSETNEAKAWGTTIYSYVKACWRASLLIALCWECILPVQFMMRYSPCGFDVLSCWCTLTRLHVDSKHIWKSIKTAGLPHTGSLEMEPAWAIPTQPHHKLNQELMSRQRSVQLSYICVVTSKHKPHRSAIQKPSK